MVSGTETEQGDSRWSSEESLVEAFVSGLRAGHDKGLPAVEDYHTFGRFCMSLLPFYHIKLKNFTEIINFSKDLKIYCTELFVPIRTII